MDQRKKFILMIASFLISSMRTLLSIQGNILQLITTSRKQREILQSAITQRNSALEKYMEKKNKSHRRDIKRNAWKIPGRTDLWWTNLLLGISPEDEWHKNLRMSRKIFMKLVDHIRKDIEPNAESFRSDTICAEKRVAMVLYYLKDQGSYRMTANSFGVSLATLAKSLRLVSEAINRNLGPELIKFPVTKDEIKNATSRFEAKFGIPQVIGCIDGTHIPIKRPSDNPQDYFCYKMKYSLNIQAICDEKGYFTDVEIKWPGSVHDARVYANSSINKALVSHKFPSIYQELLPGYTPVPQILLGDPAYPLLPNIMKEYANCIEDRHLTFNTYLRSARNQIECAFGRLKSRWRILNRPVDVDLNISVQMIYCCFVLHNYCELNTQDISNDAVQAQLNIEQRCQNCDHHDHHHIKNHFSSISQ